MQKEVMVALISLAGYSLPALWRRARVVQTDGVSVAAAGK